MLLCENAIYGTLIASLLFYNKFVKTLTRNGFELNPYDACLANRMVDGKQQTCGFHVDDCFLTGQTATNDAFVETLKEEYESVFEDGSGKLKVQRGKVLEYLGMTLDFTTAGQVKVSMFNFVDDLLRDYRKAAPEEHGIKTSAAPRNLFVVDDDCEKLDKKKAEQFHHLVAKTLFATKRARPDTGTAVSFLSTRVRAPKPAKTSLRIYDRQVDDIVTVLIDVIIDISLYSVTRNDETIHHIEAWNNIFMNHLPAETAWITTSGSRFPICYDICELQTSSRSTTHTYVRAYMCRLTRDHIESTLITFDPEHIGLYTLHIPNNPIPTPLPRLALVPTSLQASSRQTRDWCRQLRYQVHVNATRNVVRLPSVDTRAMINNLLPSRHMSQLGFGLPP